MQSAMSDNILSTSCTTVRKDLQIKDFEGHTRSAELPLFDRPLVAGLQERLNPTLLGDITTFTTYVTVCDL